MQIHDTERGETIFAYNHWAERRAADLGFGNAPGAQPDWTFSGSAGNYESALLMVFVIEE